MEGQQLNAGSSIDHGDNSTVESNALPNEDKILNSMQLMIDKLSGRLDYKMDLLYFELKSQNERVCKLEKEVGVGEYANEEDNEELNSNDANTEQQNVLVNALSDIRKEHENLFKSFDNNFLKLAELIIPPAAPSLTTQPGSTQNNPGSSGLGSSFNCSHSTPIHTHVRSDGPQTQQSSFSCPPDSLKVVSAIIKKSQPKFDGKSSHVVDFIDDLDDYFELTGVDRSAQVRVALHCLAGAAKEWGKAIDKNTSYLMFKQKLINEYWSESKQRAFEHELHSGKYLPSNEITRTEYFTKLLNRARHLEPKREDRVIIEAIIRHFPDEDENVLISNKCNEVEETKKILARLDERAEKRSREESVRAAAQATPGRHTGRVTPPRNNPTKRTAGINTVQNNSNFNKKYNNQNNQQDHDQQHFQYYRGNNKRGNFRGRRFNNKYRKNYKRPYNDNYDFDSMQHDNTNKRSKFDSNDGFYKQDYQHGNTQNNNNTNKMLPNYNSESKHSASTSQIKNDDVKN
jgi:hypothetical protein